MFGEITWVSNLKINQNSILNDGQTSLRAYLFLKFIQSSVCTFAITMHEVCFMFYFFVPLKTKKRILYSFFKEEHDIKMINYNLLFWSLESLLLQMVLARRRASSNVCRSLAISFFFHLRNLLARPKKPKREFFLNRL